MLQFLSFILNTFLKFQKIGQKIWHIQTFYVLRNISQKTDIFMSSIKKTTFGVKKVVYVTFFVFLHKTQKMSVFHETWCAHINNEM
jgi:hypothetical protein